MTALIIILIFSWYFHVELILIGMMLMIFLFKSVFVTYHASIRPARHRHKPSSFWLYFCLTATPIYFRSWFLSLHASSHIDGALHTTLLLFHWMLTAELMISIAFGISFHLMPNGNTHFISLHTVSLSLPLVTNSHLMLHAALAFHSHGHYIHIIILRLSYFIQLHFRYGQRHWRKIYYDI